jgi:PHD/YefM family antitoxin component YafN of YafNO toxin-antitoxin module
VVPADNKVRQEANVAMVDYTIQGGEKGYNEAEEEPTMNQSTLHPDRFPVVYERGRPVAVLVDLETFQHMVEALDHLKELTENENKARWVMELVRTTQAYRQAHPDETMTYDSPEAILAALDEPDA